MPIQEGVIVKFPPNAVRDDFIPKEAYFSLEFAALEAEYLWPRVWQTACRLEELPGVGDFVVYDILDDSIIVVRTSPTEVRAFHNVCPHRGRRLLNGTGRATQFKCRFHGWAYGLDGQNKLIIDKEDWGGCLSSEDTSLTPVKVGLWGGWVFINMDPDSEPLETYLQPLSRYVEKFEFEKLRYKWYKSVIMPANWKLALEFFNEFYHVQQAHPQVLTFTKDYSKSDGFGRHGMMWFAEEGAVPLGRSPRLPAKDEPDFRNLVLDFVDKYFIGLDAMVTQRSYDAAQRLRDEVSADASAEEVLTKWAEFQVEAAHEDGSGWPAELTAEYINRSGLDWHMFPNAIFLHGTIDGVLWYRSRPNGKDPESCIFDVFSLERYGEGKAPPLNREFYENWTDAEWPRIYEQDFVNIPEVQKGMRSRAFKGGRPNPVQERVVTHFQRMVREFIAEGQRED